MALEKRKATILDAIEQQGKLTAELKRRIEETLDSVVLEDIYMPFRPKRRTRAQIAIERGLEPLAKMIMSQNLSNPDIVASGFVKGDVSDVDAAIAGAGDIIAEWISENERARATVRSRYFRSAVYRQKLWRARKLRERNMKIILNSSLL